MDSLTEQEYLRKIAPDFSVLTMLEQAYYQGETSKWTDTTDIRKKIFIYPDNNPILYRAMILHDTGNSTFIDTNNKNISYTTYNYGDRFVTIAVLNDRFNYSGSFSSTGILKNNHDQTIFGVGF